MSSLGRLMPGVKAVPEIDRNVAEVKGRLEMVQVIQAAVANRQRLPGGPRRLLVGGTPLTLRPAQVRRARERARATGKPHNEARATFVKILIRELTDQLREALESSSGTGNTADRSYLAEDVRTARDAAITPARQDAMLAAVPCDPVLDLDTGHSPFLADPDGLARLLHGLARDRL